MACILIIDDDRELAYALKIALEARGYSVECAYDGEEGLRKAETIRPDLIILDVMMRTKDEGFQVSYKLKNHPELRSIPIIILTSVGSVTGFSFSTEDEDYLLADELLEKPVRPATLVERIKTLLKE